MLGPAYAAPDASNEGRHLPLLRLSKVLPVQDARRDRQDALAWKVESLMKKVGIEGSSRTIGERRASKIASRAQLR
jgi:hypothetical protein